MPAADRHAMREDDRHRIFQHGKRKRAEEEHGEQQQPADDVAMRSKIGKLANDGFGLAGQQPFEVMRKGLQQFALVDDMRKRDDDEN